MFKGTTPTLYFKLKGVDDMQDIEDVWITMRSGGESTTKTIKDSEVGINYEEKYITLDLSQEDTLAFSIKGLKVQLKILMYNGKVCASPVYSVSVEAVLNTDIMYPLEVDGGGEAEEEITE